MVDVAMTARGLFIIVLAVLTVSALSVGLGFAGFQ
jgi:hypothetical protein